MTPGAGAFVAGNREAWRSDDLGLHWDGPLATGLIPFNGRGMGFAPVAGGTFVIGGGGDNEYDIVASSDAGTSWWHPDSIATACGDGVLDIIGNDETLVMVRRSRRHVDRVARSVDRPRVHRVGRRPRLHQRRRPAVDDDAGVVGRRSHGHA